VRNCCWLVATAAENRLKHLTTHSVAGIGEPLALACNQGLPRPIRQAGSLTRLAASRA